MLQWSDFHTYGTSVELFVSCASTSYTCTSELSQKLILHHHFKIKIPYITQLLDFSSFIARLKWVHRHSILRQNTQQTTYPTDMEANKTFKIYAVFIPHYLHITDTLAGFAGKVPSFHYTSWKNISETRVVLGGKKRTRITPSYCRRYSLGWAKVGNTSSMQPSE